MMQHSRAFDRTLNDEFIVTLISHSNLDWTAVELDLNLDLADAGLMDSSQVWLELIGNLGLWVQVIIRLRLVLEFPDTE